MFSLVIGSAAVSVERDVAPMLRHDQIYVDLNSVSPATKRKVGEALGSSGVRYVEAR